MMWHKLADAGDAYNEFNEYLRKNGIFISEEIKNLFAELKALCWTHLSSVGFRCNTETNHSDSKKGRSCIPEGRGF